MSQKIWKTFFRLYPMIAPFKIGLIITGVALLLNAISDTIVISLLKPLLDEGLNNNNIFYWMPFAIIILMTLRGSSGFIANYCISWVSGNVIMNMRRKLFIHMMNMSVSFFDKHSVGTLLSRITYDSEQVGSSSSSALVIIIRETTFVISLFVLMCYHSWKLSIILIVIMCLFFFIIKLISIKFHIISKNMQNTMGVLTASAEQMFKGHKEVLIFGGQELEKQRFDIVSNSMRQQNMKIVTASNVADFLIQLIAALSLALILYIAQIPIIFNDLTAGTITVIFSSMLALMRPLKSLTNVNSQFQKGMAACHTLFSILEMKTEKNEGLLEIKSINNNISFKEVTFFYPEKKNPSLYKINFTISSGNMVALVGRSGSGKSTIANVITRFYDIQKGKILIDGIDSRIYTLESLRSKIALVSQNIHLFNDTIANNISYPYRNNQKFSFERIKEAAYQSYSIDFINNMENGFDTVIGENGVFLSGGQRQRIAIARAVLRNASVLIFDEATSALDSESEKNIQKCMYTLKKNRISLVITHRLSTIETADMILVIDEGEIVESGNHHELISIRGGIYARLYNLQCG